jgi:hypothetical protein
MVLVDDHPSAVEQGHDASPGSTAVELGAWLSQLTALGAGASFE